MTVESVMQLKRLLALVQTHLVYVLELITQQILGLSAPAIWCVTQMILGYVWRCVNKLFLSNCMKFSIDLSIFQDAATCSFRDDPTTTTTTTTTEATTTSTTTPSPKEDPAGFCAVIQQEGRFPVGTDDATTCHQYVHCLNVNGVWYGPTYNCPGKYYYDSALKSCVPKMPAHCGPKVSGLSFRSILLE
ncbi:uncharacterized protein LOC101893130 [Musca domestica]|uniref:Uncharacterized protein LOC101893130 n=1 Tax=Musca domestica TaxID=7370 RepID=A0ABM3VPB9_MUSDO|nr:uncharacterized protein LOC101893130 [Musca domestica]